MRYDIKTANLTVIASLIRFIQIHSILFINFRKVDLLAHCATLSVFKSQSHFHCSTTTTITEAKRL